VSPLRGGEADKFGHRYEGRWTTRQLLYVLQGQVDSVTVEEIGEIGKGVEFTARRQDKTEVHQVKRQHGSANQWELFDLMANGVLAAAQNQVAKGRQFWFVSTMPFRQWSKPQHRHMEPVRDQLEQDRRAFYVGLTRAKDAVVLIHGTYWETPWGSRNTLGTSRFVLDVLNHLGA
jgi:hypothetical protein